MGPTPTQQTAHPLAPSRATPSHTCARAGHTSHSPALTELLSSIAPAETRGGHSAYTHISRSAISIAADLISRLQQITALKGPQRCSLSAYLLPHARMIDKAYGAGAADIITRATVNAGMIKGGVKINLIAPHCEFDIDIRVPPNLGGDVVMQNVTRIAAEYPEVSFERTNWDPPTVSPANHHMLSALIENSHAVSGISPVPIIGLGGTDARLWRQAGVPSYVYGPSPRNMGAADEHVEISELMHVALTHALSAFDFVRKP